MMDQMKATAHICVNIQITLECIAYIAILRTVPVLMAIFSVSQVDVSHLQYVVIFTLIVLMGQMKRNVFVLHAAKDNSIVIMENVFQRL